MSKNNRFKIKAFTNPSGATVFRVEGRLPDGQRVRQNFATTQEAQAHKAELEIKALNQSGAVGLKMTRLSDAQLAEAEAAFQKLNGKSLATAIDFFLAHFTEPVSEKKTVAEASQEFLALKLAQRRRPATVSDLKSRIGFLAKHCGAKQVSQVSSNELQGLILQPGIEPQTQKHRHTKFGQFFSWCVKRRYCITNPVALLDAPEVEDNDPQVYDLGEVKALLRAARDHKNGKLIPYFALALFAGLRPAELHRISWSAIMLDEKIIRIVGGAAKRRKRRVVEISENLVEWLRPHVGQPIVGKNFQKDFNAVRRLAGFKGSMFRKGDEARKEWIADGLRHTSLSNHLVCHDHEGKTARWAGNSPDILHDKYKALVTVKEATDFWALTPAILDSEIAPNCSGCLCRPPMVPSHSPLWFLSLESMALTLNPVWCRAPMGTFTARQPQEVPLAMALCSQ